MDIDEITNEHTLEHIKEIEKLKNEVDRLKVNLREQYDLAWWIRRTMLPIHGVICKQTDDMHGVVTPDGEYISYGKEYSRRYFLGRIISP